MNINGDLILAGNLLPAQKNTYDIGSSALQWRNIYSNRLSINGGDISSYRLGVSGDMHITGYSIFDDYVNIGTSGQNTYKLYVNGKTYLNGQTIVYKDFIIKSNESTNDSTHLLFNASDNSQRAVIAWNGNVDNTFNSSTHLKIATSYGDIKILAASGNVDFGDGNRSLIWRKTNSVESGVYYHTSGRESVVFANTYQHTGWIFANGIRPSARTQWNALGVTPALQIHHNAIYVNRPVRDADTADYNLYVNGNSNLQGSIIFSGDLTAFYDSADQYLSYTAEGSVSNHAGKFSLYRIVPSGTTKVAGTKILGAQLDAASGLLHLQAAGSNPSATAGARIKFTYYNSSSDQGQAVYISSSVNDSYRAPYGIKIWGDVGTAPGAWLEVEGNLYIGSASNANSNNNSALYIRGMSAIEGYDNWLRLNDNSSFTSGTYSPKLIRSDEALQVGSSGANFYANNSGNGYFSNTLGIAGTNTEYKLYVNGTSYFNGNTTHNGIDYFANGTTYYINNSAQAHLNNVSIGGTNFGYKLYVNGASYLNGDLTIPNNYAYYGILGSNSSTTSSNVGGLTWFNVNGTAGAAANVNDTPTSAWWYILRNRHTNTGNNYYTDIAIPFNDTSIYYKIIRDNSVVNGAWIKVLDTNNYTGTLDGRYVKKSGDTMTGVLNSSYKSGTWVNSLTSSVISLSDSTGSYGGWICGPTKDGRIAISTYQGSDNKIYFGYGERGRTTNSFAQAMTWDGPSNTLTASKVYGAVWNDYAEYRSTSQVKPGQCVIETGLGDLVQSTKRLQPGANIVSDTYGFAIGETEKTKTPLAVSGRVLAYPYENRYSYSAGDPVCSGPNGTISKMTRKEVREYPDRIVGTVSEIPEYETWGTGNVKVNGRIWIKVK